MLSNCDFGPYEEDDQGNDYARRVRKLARSRTTAEERREAKRENRRHRRRQWRAWKEDARRREGGI